MKKPVLIAIFLLAIVSPALIFAMGQKKQSAVPIAFEETNGWQKLDLRAKMAWQDFAKTGSPAEFDCIMKLVAPASALDKDSLKQAGFVAQTFIGRIITGSMPAEKLPDIANLSQVEAIELSTPMSLKKRPKSPSK